jgi:hypothetical protein
MKKTSVPLVFALMIGVLLLTHLAIAQSTISISVSTSKGSYNLREAITIAGQVLNGSTPVPNAVVVFELRDSQNQVKASGYMTTDQSGQYSRTVSGNFTQGGYTVYVNVTVGNQTASNNTAFQVVPEFPAGIDFVLTIALILSFGLTRITQRKTQKHLRLRHLCVTLVKF